MVIQHTNSSHSAACATAEGSRQQAIAAAIAAGGGSAAVGAAIKTGEIAYYQGLIVSAKLNGQPYSQFVQALNWLGGTL